MSVEQNKATLKRSYDEVWNKGNMSVIPELVSDDYRFANYKGQKGFQDLVTTMRSVFPDIHWTIDGVVGEGDWLAVRLSYTGTFLGKYGDNEPTGKSFKATRALFNRFSGGKLVEAIPYVDHLALYQQVGIPTPNPVEETNKANQRRVWEEVFNKGDLGIVPELFAPEYTFRSALGMEFKGPDGFKQMVAMTRKALPDLHFAVDDMVAEGDKVVSRFTLTGTFKGEMMGFAPTGKKATVTGIIIAQWVGGKEVQAWESLDTLAFYQQLGVTPPKQ